MSFQIDINVKKLFSFTPTPKIITVITIIAIATI